jgi:glycine oxidase
VEDIFDVIVIGGGVIGLSIARELKKRGAGQICVLEKSNVGREASWAAAGILAPQVEADEDGDFFRLCYESNRSYRQFADELQDETGTNVELDQSGVVYAGFDDSERAEFDHRYKWQRSAGLNVELLDRGGIKKLEPNISDKVVGGMYFPDDGQVENRKLVEALEKFAKLNGIKIDQGVEIDSVELENGAVSDVRSRKHTYKARTVIVATGAWTSLIKFGEGILPVTVKPIRGQMVCYRPDELRLGRVVYSKRGYLVPRADGRLLAGATAEDVGFDRSTSDEGISGLIDAAVEIAPALKRLDIVDKWAGLRPYIPGGIPFIGPVPGVKGLFAAAGHFRNGILLAPITARMIADEMLGSREQFDTIRF